MAEKVTIRVMIAWASFIINKNVMSIRLSPVTNGLKEQISRLPLDVHGIGNLGFLSQRAPWSYSHVTLSQAPI